MNMTLEIAFIGGGNMAQAMGRGLVKAKGSGQSFHIVDRNEDILALWRELGASTSLVVSETLSQCKVWILAVKPQGLKEVCAHIKPFLQADTLVISVAAGISMTSLQTWLGHQNIVRTMPNTPALVGMGMTGMFANTTVSAADVDYAEAILRAMGGVVKVSEEALIDSVTALSGSGPAYIYLFIESLIAGAVKMGLSAEQAKEMAVATVAGAAKMVETTGETPAKLRENVSSKGGTTLAALSVFYERGLPNIVEEAMAAAARRAGELSRELA
ncbi:MAG: pyrroline-5-carboxylate reductase [Pelistega sp.]|nr:pyrroline-5-carboxylate reductase [Pelistega sp.]